MNTMTGSATITILPGLTIYKMDPIGQQCPGTIIRLNGSDLGVNYYLLFNGIPVDTIPGTGYSNFLISAPKLKWLLYRSGCRYGDRLQCLNEWQHIHFHPS